MQMHRVVHSPARSGRMRRIERNLVGALLAAPRLSSPMARPVEEKGKPRPCCVGGQSLPMVGMSPGARFQQADF